MQALTNENMTLQQQQQHETGLHTATTGPRQNVQMERWIGVWFSLKRSRMNLVDVKGAGKPSVFQNDESRLCEWVKKIKLRLIGFEPHLEAMLTWSLQKEAETRQIMTADMFGENGDPTEHVGVYAQLVVRPQNCSGTSPRRRLQIDRAEVRTRRTGSVED